MSLIDHAAAQAEYLHELQTQMEGLAFPYQVFPEPFQRVIEAANATYLFPKDFLAGGMLAAMSIALGNAARIDLKAGFSDSAALYMAIVGPAGTNKTWPLNFCMKPIKERDKINFAQWQKEKAEWNAHQLLNEKERREQGIERKPAPVWQQHTTDDATPEALVNILMHNRRGIGSVNDELAGWFKNFDRYNKGSEMHKWLSLWSNQSVVINRKNSDPLLVPTPFASVVGNIQPDILATMNSVEFLRSGFLDRILFVFPEKFPKVYWTENELPTGIAELYTRLIARVMELDVPLDNSGYVSPRLLPIRGEARRTMIDNYNTIVDLREERQEIAGQLSKLQTYANRFALILEAMYYASGAGDFTSISPEAMKGSVELSKYFTKTAEKVQRLLGKGVLNMSEEYRKVWKQLPDRFETAKGIRIATHIGMSQRTFQRFLNDNPSLFSRVKQGVWQKIKS